MNLLRKSLRFGLVRAEAVLDLCFPAAQNPLRQLGALGFFFYWIVAVSGIYVYIFFDTGLTEAYGSVEALTYEQWYIGGVMRSFHRYASDALVVVVLIHLVREFAYDRYRGSRWFSWLTGVPILGMVFVAGITGYWLVWDRLAQYVAVTTSEWLDRLPMFGGAIIRNFLAPDTLDDRFFTLMVFIHIAVPLIALFVMWIHLQRLAKPRINPPRALAAWVLAGMIGLALVHPAESQAPADLGTVPSVLGLDWFYLGFYPLIERGPGLVTWGAFVTVTVIALVMPWLPPMRKPAPATVNLDNCNGCARCAEDCPYTAIEMVARSDGAPFTREAKVDPALCVSCGICMGACPTAMPFRRRSALVAGIELPELTAAALRDRLTAVRERLTEGPRVVVFGCGHGVPLAGLDDAATATVELACIGQLPPAFVDWVLSRGVADGVVLTGCAPAGCFNRRGIEWTEGRLAGTRDPHLRASAPRDRILTVWAGAAGRPRLERALIDLRERLAALPASPPRRRKVAHG